MTRVKDVHVVIPAGVHMHNCKGLHLTSFVNLVVQVQPASAWGECVPGQERQSD